MPYSVAEVDGILGATFLRIDGVVRAVVEDDAVLQYLANAGTLVVVGSLEHLDGAGRVGGNGTGKEVTACSEAKLCGAEGVLDGAVG